METKICKYCGKKFRRESAEFCSQNCYQKWRYHNIKEVKQKVIKAVSIRSKERYATDKNYREQAKKYSRAWQKKNPKRMVELVMKSQAKKKEMELMIKQAKGED